VLLLFSFVYRVPVSRPIFSFFTVVTGIVTSNLAGSGIATLIKDSLATRLTKPTVLMSWLVSLFSASNLSSRRKNWVILQALHLWRLKFSHLRVKLFIFFLTLLLFVLKFYFFIFWRRIEKSSIYFTIDDFILSTMF